MPRKADSPSYRSWTAMIARCHIKSNIGYEIYGGRGITVCERWRGADGFPNFLSDIGEKPSAEHSIDRYPNNCGNYEPGNVRWATRLQQARNKSNNTAISDSSGNRVTAQAIADSTGLPKSTVVMRIKHGWSHEKIVSCPRQSHRMKDISGQPFGLLTAISPHEKRGVCWYWLCSCECGGKKIANVSELVKGSVQSCGCLVGNNGLRLKR